MKLTMDDIRLMVFQFSDLGLARSFSARTEKASAIVMGDNEKFWVVTLAMAQWLEKRGYEVVD